MIKQNILNILINMEMVKNSFIINKEAKTKKVFYQCT